MEQRKGIKKIVKSQAGILLILILASAVRLMKLGSIPNGTYTDEAYGAYLAYGLLTEGMDDWGYHFPVYFTAWGSGMSALYLYIGAFLFKLFGISLTVYRIPQALMGICAVYALYIVCGEIFDKRLALLAALALAVNPWHIMMCRFGLDANLAPNMFLVGLMFLVLGVKKKDIFWIPAAVCFGFTLYCYALTWLFLPTFLVLCLVLFYRQLPEKKWVFSFACILFVMAIPLFLFLAVNFDLIPEIKTSFLSIPKLTGFRGGELAPENIRAGIGSLFALLVTEQGDGRVLLSCEVTGSYYYFTTPLFVFGVISHMVMLVRDRRKGEHDLSFVFFAWLLCAGIVSILNHSITMIHVNMIHIPVIFYGAYGIWKIDRLLHSRKTGYICTAFYLFSFAFFIKTYNFFGFPDFFDEKPYEAVETAREIAGEDGVVTIVGFDATYKYPNLLWQEKWSISDYAENKVMDGDPYFANLVEYGTYRYMDENLGDMVVPDGVYVIKDYQIGDFRKRGFEIIRVNEQYAVAAGSQSVR